jgi:molybdopterin converting factor small subunit
MRVHVRLSAGLAQEVGLARLTVTLSDGATVADLREQLRAQHPAAAPQLALAVPVIAGQAVDWTAPLASDQEVAFLLPIAGGSR